MIFWDRVTVICRTKATASAPVTETFNGTVPAIVTPMSADQGASPGIAAVVLRYQIALKPFSYAIPLNASSKAPSAGGANQILFAYRGHSPLLLDGKVERHLLRGRLHHYELAVRAG